MASSLRSPVCQNEAGGNVILRHSARDAVATPTDAHPYTGAQVV